MRDGRRRPLPARPHPRRDGVGATTNICAPERPPLDRAHLGAHAPSNRRGSRPDGGGVARGGGPRARALSPGGDADRRDRKKNRRGGRARGDPRDERPAHRPASPSAAQRGLRANPRRLGARSASAPSRRVVSAPVPVRGDAREADSFINRVVAVSPRSRALARGLHLVGHLSIERWGAHVAVIPVREHPDDPAPTALVLAGSKGLRSRARAHALSTRGCVPRPVGPRAHDPLPDRPPQSARLPALGPTSLREELTRVSLLPWSVARAMGIDGFSPDAREPEGFAAAPSGLTSRLESGAFGGYVSLRVASNLDPERAFPLRFYASGGGAGIRCGILAANDIRRAASPRTGRPPRGRTRASRRSARGSTPRAPGDRRFFVGAIRASPPSPRTCRIGRTRRARAAVEARLSSSRRERETEAYLWWTRETRGDACATAADG